MGSSLRGCSALLIWLFVNYCLEAQPANVGIGVEDPTQKLSVDGAIQIGMNQEDSLQPGTIRWNPETSDFEGFTGYDWKSLTKTSGATWGTNSIIESGSVVPSGADSGDHFAWSLDTDGDYTVIGAYSDDDEGFNAGAAYVFVRTGNSWIVQQKLVATDADVEDWFGYSVGISGDYVIIGAPYDDATGTDAGAAYVFSRSGDSWTQQSKLIAPDGAGSDFMGISVDISGDYCIVGASEDDGEFDNSGSAYIFRRSMVIWLLHEKLTASDAGLEDQFGVAVAIDGSYCVIGALNDDDIDDNSGAAYVFHRSGNDWQEQAKLKASNAVSGDRFGGSVDIFEDWIVIGAYLTHHSGQNCGSAYVFMRDGEEWDQTQILVALDARTYDWFGFRVALKGDFLLISAVGYDPDANGSARGCAYIFEYNGTLWEQRHKLLALTGESQDEFGRGAALSDHAAVVGAPGDATGGVAYFYHLQN